MPDLRVRRGVSAADVFLAIVALASAFAYVRAQSSPIAAMPLALGLLVELDGVGDRTRRIVERGVRTLALVVALIGISWTLYLITQPEQFLQWRGALGALALALLGLFLAGRRVWSPGRGLLPVCFMLLVLASVGPGPRVTPALVVVALALVGWLVVERSPDVPDAARRDRPTGRRWASAGGFALLSAAVAGAIISVLPVAQPLVERLARGALWSQGSAGLSESGSLGAVESLGLSQELVLRMWADRPGLLRARVHTDFDGRSWTSTPAGTHLMDPAPDGVAADPTVTERLSDVPGSTYTTGLMTRTPPEAARVLLAWGSRGWVVAPRGARTLRITGGTPTVNREGVLKAPFSPPPALYGVTWAEPVPDTLEPGEREATLAVPEDLDPRMSELAASLAPPGATPRERIDATVALLADCCTYSLDVGAFSTGQPVVEFLFDKQRGYCEYFASAAALLLRLQGVPARYVTGLSVTPLNRVDDHYEVRASDAHAWIEAWIEGEGWVEVDPTPPDQYAALRAGLEPGRLQRVREAVAGFFTEVVARFTTDWRAGIAWLFGGLASAVGTFLRTWRLPLTVIAAVAVGVALWRGRGRFTRRARAVERLGPVAAGHADVAPELARLISRLEARWAAAGSPRPASRGFLEHLEAMGGSDEASLHREVIACYYRGRYGAEPVTPDEVGRLEAALGRPG